jgi:hypothetical protein
MMRSILLFTLLCAAQIMTAQESTVIIGRLLGSDGRPMPVAHLHLFRPNQLKSVVTVEAAKDGSFHLTTSAQGLVLLKCTGVNHRAYEVPLLIGSADSIELNVKLQTYGYPTRIDSISIIGDFNSFSYGSAVPMERQADSTFAIEFTTSSPELAYQLVGGDVNRVNGTQADDYVYDGSGGYRSVVKVRNGKVRIVFDPRMIVRSKEEASVEWKDSAREAFASIYRSILRRREAYQQALMEHRKAGKDISDFRYNWRPDLLKIVRRVAGEQDTLLRQALLLSYLDLGTCDATKDLDQKVIRQALAEIPPTSPLWAINPRLVTLAIGRCGEDSACVAYLQQVIRENADPGIKAPLLYDLLVTAHRNSESDKARGYYDRLVTEFSNTPYAGMARVEFASR